MNILGMCNEGLFLQKGRKVLGKVGRFTRRFFGFCRKINAILEYIVQNARFSERDKRKLSRFGEYSSYFEFLDVIGEIEDKVGKEYDDPPENEKKRFQRELGKLIGDIIYKESIKII